MSRERPPRAADSVALTAGMREPPPSSSTAATSSGASPLRASSSAAGAAALLKKPPANSSKSCLQHERGWAWGWRWAGVHACKCSRGGLGIVADAQVWGTVGLVGAAGVACVGDKPIRAVDT